MVGEEVLQLLYRETADDVGERVSMRGARLADWEDWGGEPRGAAEVVGVDEDVVPWRDRGDAVRRHFEVERAIPVGEDVVGRGADLGPARYRQAIGNARLFEEDALEEIMRMALPRQTGVDSAF